MSGYKAEAALLKAMAHPARLRILDILAEGDACVCHVTAILSSPQPYISQQLTVLRQAGLVQSRRDGQMVYYSLANARISGAVELMRQVVLRDNPDAGFETVPASPLDRCTCPRCEALRG